MLAVHIVLNSFLQDSRVIRETRYIKSRGWDVRVIGLNTSLRESQLPFDYFGIKVYLLKLWTKNGPQNTVFQFIKYLEFVLRSLPLVLRAKVIHCHDLAPLPIGVLAKVLTFGKIKIIYDSHELQSETLYNKNPLKKKSIRFLEKFLSPFVDEVIVVSPFIAEYYKKLLKRDVLQIYNCPDVSLNKNSNTNKLRTLFPEIGNKKIFVSIGLLTPGRGIETILKHFIDLNLEKAALVLIGNGPLVPIIKKSTQQNRNIYYLPAVPSSEVLDYIASADVGIVGMEPSCLNHNFALPNKFFEYIFAGLPVLSSHTSQLMDVINSFKCGEIYTEEPKSFLNACENLISLPKSAFLEGILRVQKEFNWQKCTNILDKIYI